MDVWESALRIVSGESTKLLVGFGYGATRFYLNWREESPKFFASHCHNSYIEHLFAMGLFGVVIFVILIFISTEWLTKYEQLIKMFGEQTCRNAVSTVIIVVISSLTETTLGGRINPLALLFVLYIVCLDRKSWRYGGICKEIC